MGVRLGCNWRLSDVRAWRPLHTDKSGLRAYLRRGATRHSGVESMKHNSHWGNHDIATIMLVFANKHRCLPWLYGMSTWIIHLSLNTGTAIVIIHCPGLTVSKALSRALEINLFDRRSGNLFDQALIRQSFSLSSSTHIREPKFILLYNPNPNPFTIHSVP